MAALRYNRQEEWSDKLLIESSVVRESSKRSLVLRSVLFFASRRRINGEYKTICRDARSAIGRCHSDIALASFSLFAIHAKQQHFPPSFSSDKLRAIITCFAVERNNSTKEKQRRMESWFHRPLVEKRTKGSIMKHLSQRSSSFLG